MALNPFRRLAVIIVTLAAAAAASGHLSAAEDTSFDDRFTRYCFNCHAADPSSFAYPRYAPPKIAGQDTPYLVAALTEYREGRRNHYLMNSPAEMLPIDVIDDLAAYISRLDGANLPRYASKPPDANAVSRGWRWPRRIVSSAILRTWGTLRAVFPN